MEPNRIEIHTHDQKAAFVELCKNILAQQGWKPKTIHDIHLGLDEALVNALRHGNQEDYAKMVLVLYLITPEACSFEITDEGKGFNPDNLPNPFTPENLEKPTGRGVFLMRHYMNEVVFNKKGNTVWLKKTTSGPQPRYVSSGDFLLH